MACILLGHTIGDRLNNFTCRPRWDLLCQRSIVALRSTTAITATSLRFFTLHIARTLPRLGLLISRIMCSFSPVSLGGLQAVIRRTNLSITISPAIAFASASARFASALSLWLSSLFSSAGISMWVGHKFKFKREEPGVIGSHRLEADFFKSTSYVSTGHFLSLRSGFSSHHEVRSQVYDIYL